MTKAEEAKEVKPKRYWMIGPILGVQRLNMASFVKGAVHIELFGFEAVSPLRDKQLCSMAVKLSRKGANRGDFLKYIERKLYVMATCDGVYLLPYWADHYESQIELLTALQCGMETFLDEDEEEAD